MSSIAVLASGTGQAEILNAVESVNRRQKEVLVRKMQQHFGEGGLKGRTIALWGLAFKPNTDDMRDAPARAIIEALWKEGAKVRAYDPVAGHEARRIYGDREGLVICGDAYETLQGADALAIATEWQEFRSPDFDRAREVLKAPLIFDGRNLYDPALVSKLGFTYYGIGRGKSVVGTDVRA